MSETLVENPSLTADEILDHFPRHGQFAKGPLSWQVEYIRATGAGARVIEGPTGTGKSAVEYAILQAAYAKYGGPVIWIAPTKAIVGQLHPDFPDLPVLYGSNEILCLFAAAGYDPEQSRLITADQAVLLAADPAVRRRDEVPCCMINKGCPHLVSQQTGETNVPGALGCEYYVNEYTAHKHGQALCTFSFYLFARAFGGRTQKFDTPTCLVIDEAHQLPDTIRNSLSYDVTDANILQAVALLKRIGAAEATVLERFFEAIKQIARDRQREPLEEHLLEDHEIGQLIAILNEIDTDLLARKIVQGVTAGKISLKTESDVVKRLETLTRDIRRYIHSFEYSLPSGERPPLNYTCAFYRADRDQEERKRIRYKLVVRCHNVAPIVRKRLLSPLTFAFSATFVNPKVFEWESGIGGKFFFLDTPFPVERTRLYVPTDIFNLRYGPSDRDRNIRKTLRRIAQTCLALSREGFRSLVVVIANRERQWFLDEAVKIALDAVSYGPSVSARDIAAKFREGHGQVLVGTSAQYAHGLDLPGQIAPFIFFLRPGNQNPRDAVSQYEERHWKPARIYATRQRRIMSEALQVRGRNIRGMGDVGVTVFMSEQFRPVVIHAVPESLKPAYRGDLRFDDAVADAVALLKVALGKV